MSDPLTYADVCGQEIQDAADDMQDVLETIQDRYDNPQFDQQQDMRKIVRQQFSDIKEDVETIEKVLDEAFEESDTKRTTGGDNKSSGK